METFEPKIVSFVLGSYICPADFDKFMITDTQHKEAQYIQKVTETFMRYGFKSVTMTDIARELGISKKTLYQFVDNKNELILRCVIMAMTEEKEFIANIKKQNKNAIEEMLDISAHVNQTLRKINPAAIYDLQKYYSDAWEIVEAYTHEFIFTNVKENLERGMEEGLYRTDFRPDIIARLFIGKSQLILNNTLFPYSEYKTSELHRAHTMYHIRGVASPKGLKLLEKHIKELED